MQLQFKDYRVSLSQRRLKYTHGKPGAAVITATLQGNAYLLWQKRPHG